MQIKDLWQKYFAYTPVQEYEFNLTSDPEQNSQAQSDNVENPQKQIENIFPSLSVNLEYMKTRYNLMINSDVVLILSQYIKSMDIFHDKYYGYNSRSGQYEWSTK